MLRVSVALGAAALVAVIGCGSSGTRVPTTAAPTVAAQAFPKPTATSLPSLEVVSKTLNREGRYVNVVGEVKNIGDRAVQFPKVSVTLYDGGDAVIDTDTTYLRAPNDRLMPGETASFKSTIRYNENIAAYKVVPQGN